MAVNSLRDSILTLEPTSIVYSVDSGAIYDKDNINSRDCQNKNNEGCGGNRFIFTEGVSVSGFVAVSVSDIGFVAVSLDVYFNSKELPNLDPRNINPSPTVQI